MRRAPSGPGVRHELSDAPGPKGESCGPDFEVREVIFELVAES
jgi:hypothetical protein